MELSSLKKIKFVPYKQSGEYSDKFTIEFENEICYGCAEIIATWDLYYQESGYASCGYCDVLNLSFDISIDWYEMKQYARYDEDAIIKQIELKLLKHYEQHN